MEQARVSESDRPKQNPERKSILLVEDDEGVRNLTVRILTRAGYEILAMAGGGEVFNLPAARLARMELLITDVVLGGINGADVASRLKAEHPSLRVLFISGYTDHPLLARGIFQNGTDLLQKPYSPDQLLKAVESVLEHADQVR
jgi:DNA-binding NtrC family response regulator